MTDPNQTTPTAAETAVLEDLIDRALAEAQEGGKAGIAAAVMRGDTLLARGMNEVHLNHDPTRHAEIVAISAATRSLGEARLTGCTLVTTLQPCEMCLAAMRFAGIKRVIFAGQKPNVDQSRYFVFPDIMLDQFKAADHDDFTAIGGACEQRVKALYAKGDN